MKKNELKGRLTAAFLALMTAVMFITSTAAGTVYAADSKFTVTSTVTPAGTLKPGDSFTVAFNVTENTGLSCFDANLVYNATSLKLTDIAPGTVQQEFEPSGPAGVDPDDYDGDPTGYADACTEATNIKNKMLGQGRFYSMQKSATGKSIKTGALATATFEVLDTASSGDCTITLDVLECRELDENKNAIPFATGTTTFPTTTVKIQGAKLPFDGTVPAAPTVSEIKSTSMKVSPSTGCEFTYSDTALSDFTSVTWEKTEKTVTDLKPNTKYYVYQRAQETDTHRASNPSVAKEATTAKLSMDDVVSSISIGTKGSLNTELTPVITYKGSYSATDAGTLTYKWSNNETTKNYKITAADVTNKAELYVTVTAANLTGSKDSNKVTAGKDAYAGTVPAKPTVSDITANGFTVTPSTGCEFTYSKTAITDFSTAVWQTTVKVEGLDPNTSYYVYQRVAETASTMASAASPAATAKTAKIDIADVIDTISIGTSASPTTVLTPDITYKTGFDADDAGTLTYKWSNNTTAKTYTVTAADATGKKELYVTVTAANCSGTKASNKLTAGKEAYAGAAPAAPTISNLTSSGFTVTVSDGCEYTYSKTAITDFSNATWKTTTAVTGLTPNTEYFVYQRVKETATTMPSGASLAATAKTTKPAVSDAIASVSIGTNGAPTTVLTPIISYKTGYDAASLGDLTYSWSNGTAASTYTITAADATANKAIYVTISSANLIGTIDSNTVTAGKDTFKGTVTAPVVTAKGTGFVINNIPGYQYAVLTTNSAPAETDWVDFGTENVTKENMTAKQTYYVFSRAKETTTTMASAASTVRTVTVLNNNCDLTAITMSGYSVTPAFDKDILEYTVQLPLNAAAPVLVYSQKADPTAKAFHTQAKNFAADNAATIVVTAQNGVDTKTYKVTFTQQGRSDAPVITTDSTVSLSRKGTVEITGTGKIYYTTDGTAPTAASKEYTAAIDVATLSIPLTTSTLTIKAVAVEDGKAISEVTTKTFNLTDATAKLATLTVNGTSVTGFNPSVLSYTYIIPYHSWKAAPTTVYTIEGTTSDAGATVAAPPAAATTSADSTKNSEDKRNVVVTSAEGESTTYTVNIVVQACTHVNKTTTPVIAADCTTAGTEKVICDDCGKEISTRTLGALGHDYGTGVITQNATCLLPEVRTFNCSRCADSYTVQTAPATGHKFAPQNVPATCTAGGINMDVCSVCYAPTNQVMLSALGHTWGAWTQQGDTTTYIRTCSTCSVTETKIVTDNTHVHQFTVHNIVTPATCDSTGTETLSCSVAGCTESITQEIPMSNIHSLVKTIIPAECEKDGTETEECSVCGRRINFKIIPATGHTWGPYVGDTATCLNGGYATATCTKCPTTTKLQTPAKGHVESGWITETPVTATDSGKQYKECTVCKTRLTEEPIAVVSSISTTSSLSIANSIQKGTALTLSCTATSSTGAPQYQWFKSSINSSVGGTAVGAAGSTCSVDTSTIGTTYYYCMADGKASNVMMVVVADAPAPVTPVPVTPSTTYYPSYVYTGNGLPPLNQVIARYSFISGANSSWQKGTKTGLEFKVDGSIGKFSGIKVDGKTLSSPNDFTASIGSTVIVLQPKYLETLGEGMHTITAQYVDGSATTRFEVYGQAVDVAPEAGVNVRDSVITDNGRNGTIVVIGICAAAMLAVTGFATYTARKKK